VTPDSTKHNPSPEYLRELIERAGVSQRGAARLLGISERPMRRYLSKKDRERAPYLVQFGLECLAGAR